jgi:1-pyrroline-4-hydroxy-2-carboxylate deaminase
VIFEGVIPAVVTPFGDDGEVDVTALASNAEWMLDCGARGLVSTGTMGESQSLSTAERRLVVETLVEATAGRGTVTVGVSSETPGTTSALAADAAAAGADGLMLLPPLGYEGDDRESEAFYRADEERREVEEAVRALGVTVAAG